MMQSQSTILWADDDPDDLLLMRDILAKNKVTYNIVEVTNGKEALDYLEKSKLENNLPCLVILDINMPVLDGKETLVRMKQNEAYKNIPVVMFTTSASELDKIFFQKYNVEMITKPPEYKSLELVVNKLIQSCTVPIHKE